MDPLTIDRTQILVLNYNGKDLLAECLPSIIEAAEAAPVPCGVTVVDNDSRDDSIALAASAGPPCGSSARRTWGWRRSTGSCAPCDEPVVLLLNNDVKLARDAVAPLLRVFEQHDDALFSAPLCWTFDGQAVRGNEDAGAIAVRAGPGNEPRSGLRGPGRPVRPDGCRRAGAGRRSSRSSSPWEGTTRSISRGGSRTSTWASAAGWPAIAATTSPGRSPTTAAWRRSARSWAWIGATAWRSATASCSPGRTCPDRGSPRI